MHPDAFLERFRAERASAIVRASDRDVAAHAMEAAIRAGFRIVEFTLTTPHAFELIAEFAARDDLVVGAGTVLDADDARRAVAAGARFVVSPVTDPAVIAAAAELGVAAMPGTFTPTEMLAAHRAGAQICKLFPGPEGGPRFVKSILAPLPFLRIVPTNGVHLNNAAAYLKAGAFAVGFTTALFDPAAMAARDWDAIEAKGARLLEECR